MKKLNFILSLLAVFAGSPLFAQEKEKPVVEMASDGLGNVEDAFQELFFEALKQKAIENYDRAIDALVRALTLAKTEPVVYLELGKNYNALEKHNQAASYLEMGRKLVPGNKDILAELYNTYYLSNEYDKALPVVFDLSKIDPSFSEDLVNLYILNERFDEAINLLDELDEKKGSSTYRESLRRQVYARTNNVEAQIADLQENIEENPKEEADYLNLIFVYSENGDVDKAFATAQELLRVNPSSELVHLALYKFYMAENASDKAVNSMKILLESDQIDEVTKYQALNDFLLYVTPDSALEEDLVELVNIFSEKENNLKVYKQLGIFFLEKGDLVQALEYFNVALQHDSGDFGLYKNLLMLHMETGNYKEAAFVSEKAMEVFPSQPLLYLSNGMALNKLSNYKEAEEILTLGLDFVIDDTVMERNFYLELSDAYRGLGNNQKTTEYQKKAENLKNNH